MVNERYQQSSQKWQIWHMSFQWHRGASCQVTSHIQFYVGWLESRVVVDCCTVRLFHIATILLVTCICCLKLYMALLRWRVFCGVGWGLTSICWWRTQLQFIFYLAPCTDLGNRGYFDVERRSCMYCINLIKYLLLMSKLISPMIKICGDSICCWDSNSLKLLSNTLSSIPDEHTNLWTKMTFIFMLVKDMNSARWSRQSDN